ncbi:MAG: substrate-binding domain-containing protein [Oscillospiraceae bacterium]|nr:substrate-binding domain-containing protein [Oscillospiraceae bacterium]
MKKTLAVLIIAVLMLSLVSACSSDSQSPAGDPTPNGSSTPAKRDEPVSEPVSEPVPESAPVSDFDSGRVIGVHTREDGSGTRDAFVSITGVGDDMYEEAVVLGSTNEILSAVGANEYAVGYISVGSLNNTVKALSIDGVLPSNATVKDGSYAIQRPFLICMSEEKLADPLVNDFISFMLSAQGQAQIGSSWTMIDESAPDYVSSGLTGALRVGGSTSVEPLMQKMREAYLALNGGVTIDISSTGSGDGINGATAGEYDIGMSSRELREAELESLTPVSIALDGVAVIVNTANPLEELTITQVKDIFTGEITRWSAVG